MNKSSTLIIYWFKLVCGNYNNESRSGVTAWICSCYCGQTFECVRLTLHSDRTPGLSNFSKSPSKSQLSEHTTEQC